MGEFSEYGRCRSGEGKSAEAAVELSCKVVVLRTGAQYVASAFEAGQVEDQAPVGEMRLSQELSKGHGTTVPYVLIASVLLSSSETGQGNEDGALLLCCGSKYFRHIPGMD
jgi:hypothetical protein